MRTLFAAVAGALALAAVLVAYDLGERRTFSRDMTPMPTMHMTIGPDGVARPYLLPAGQAAYGQVSYAAVPTGWSSYGLAVPAAAAPYGAYPVQMQYVTERVATQQPVVRRVSSQRFVASERASPQRSWQKSVLVIGGSAGTGAGLGALMGGKKGALAGAAIGGGAAAIYDQVKRR